MSEYYEPGPLPAEDQSEENKLVNRALSALPIPHISGLKLKGDVKLGDLTLNTIDRGTPEEPSATEGVIWICTDIDGWWNIPDPEFPELTRGWGDGSYDAVGRYAARILNLSGSFLTQDPSQVEPARQKLIEAIDLVYRGANLVVSESETYVNDDDVVVSEPRPKVSFVRLSGRPEITSTKARGRHDFSIGLKAPDHVKYEYLSTAATGIEPPFRVHTLSRGQSVTLVNRGNTKTPFIFEISGTTATNETLTIRNTYNGGVVQTLGSIVKPSTGTAYTTEIDTYNRTIQRVAGGVATPSRSDANSFVDWLQLYPGENTVSFTSSGSSSVTCKIYYRSGWIG
jgi:hypothetical protein